MIHKTYSKRLKKDVWAISERIGGVRVRRGGFETRKAADDALTALKLRERAELYGTRLREPEVTLDELREARAADPMRQGTEMRRRLLIVFSAFVDFAGPRTPVRRVTTSLLREFRETLIRRPLGPAATNLEMQAVTGSLNSARLYFAELETFRSPSLPKMATQGRATLVPRHELRSLVNALRTSTQWRKARLASADVLEMLQLTGARLGEVCAITSKDVDFERGLLTIYAPKTSTKRTIPITESMAVILRRRSSFPAISDARHCIGHMAMECEIGFGRDHWVLHDIRHTAASVLAEAGISHSIIAALLGHALGGMTARYTHATLPGLRQAVGTLESYWLGEVRRLHVVGEN